MARKLCNNLLAVALVACTGCRAGESRPSTPSLPGSPGGVFTPAHATIADAVRDFFGVIPIVPQPLAFPHNAHVAKGVKCTEYCHEAATKGPVAGIPGVKTCMICHAAIATDRPLVQVVADYEKRNVDIPWQRVYGYTHEAHVLFQHAPHIRADIDCANCHGQTDQQTVAQRNVNLTMGFCVDCHRSKRAPNECATCHY